MPINVKYNDDTCGKYDDFDNITDNMNVIYIDCSNNNLTSLPDNMNILFPNLKGFYCDNNNLTSLPPNMNFPKMKYFNCNNNNLYYILPHIYCYVEKDYNTKSPKHMKRKLLI